tara:strand:- start:1117 stop:2094 length:978 start_codon:yes stop_codon:yes gene_type:complete
MQTFVVYHTNPVNNCADGSLSAAIAYSHLTEAGVQPTMFEMEYNNDDHFNALLESCKDREVGTVYIVDFSLYGQQLKQISDCVSHVVILDHHKSAIDRLNAKLPKNVNAILDKTRSGAMLTYDYFNNIRTTLDQTPTKIQDYPTAIRLIGVRDMWLPDWQTNYPEAKPFHSTLISKPLQTYIEVYRKNTKDLEGFQNLLGRYVKEGEISLNVLKEIMDAHAKKSFATTWNMVRDGKIHHIRVLISFMPPEVISDYADSMKNKYDLVANVQFESLDEVKLSLRSSAGWAEIAALTLSEKGGGHENAAGCFLKIQELYKLCKMPGLE